MTEYLPLGSVVTLKDGTKKVMITGRVQQDETTGRIYDYCAVLWPEGMLDSSRMYLFDHKDLGLLYFIGLQDEEEFQFRFELEEKLNSIGIRS